MRDEIRLGATPLGGGRCAFTVWAPRAERGVEVEILEEPPRRVPLQRGARGYWRGTVEDAPPGTLYRYRLDGRTERADPASRWQPQGVHGPSAVLDPRFHWTDACWTGLRLEDYVIYELHVGTFTRAGTFDAVVPHLDGLRELGVTAIELMPVAQFPGSRNWGYDGAFPFAAQDSYGGPDGLRRLADACHDRGLAVVLDVVHNHLGPEGNYLADFGPYFTSAYHTPWGEALNFDGAGSTDVRRFFVENALGWVTDFHVDALRLDAVHAILDRSATHVLEELATAVRDRAARLGRRIHLMAECDLNAPRYVRSQETGGYGLDALWSDDFHHALHALLTGERSGYYADFGGVEQLVRAFRDGFAYTGQYSEYRQRRQGRPATGLGGERFVVFAQNHDQVGNRMRGERLTRLVSFEALKLAAVAVTLSPYLPLLFMGEEYGETAPFPYFVSHSDPELVEAVRRGRREEFGEFRWAGEPPDPQALSTFESAKLDHRLRDRGQHRALRDLYRELLRLRRETAALGSTDRERVGCAWTERTNGLPNPPDALAPPRIGDDLREPAGRDRQQAVAVRRRGPDGADVALLFHFGDAPTTVALSAMLPAGRWRTILNTADERWGGPGSATPDEVDASEELELLLPAQGAVVLERRAIDD